MTVPAPSLDDRRFQDLVDEAKRLIPKYCPEWTNHNLSDPGIALIELFAWMTELTLYRVNQLPERLFCTFLDLVGIDLFSAQAARTHLTFWLSATVGEAVTVPGGTQVATAEGDHGEAVVFMTDEDLVIAQPQLVACLTSDQTGRYTNRWNELRDAHTAVTCFTSPLAPGDALYLGFKESLAGNVVRLALSADAKGIGIRPPHPPLAWEVWEGTGWTRARVRQDTTGGLNQPGHVELFLPRQHVALTLGGTSAHWLRVRLTEAEPDCPTYQASPRLRSASAVSLGGIVAAHHAHPAPEETLGRSTGEPGQVFHTRHQPVLPRRFGEVVKVRHASAGDGTTEEEWTERENFAQSGPQDRHVVWDGRTGEVRFGPRVRQRDGTYRQHGAVPPPGADIIVSGYRHGGGRAGNVGAGTLKVLRTSIPYIDAVENLDRAEGGVDPETVADAKLRGPMSLRAGGRAVTADDFQRLTLDAAPSVARARCLPPQEPGGPVRLLLVPRLEEPPADIEIDDLALSDDLVHRVRAHLDERRILGTDVQIGVPYYQGVTVTALVKAVPEVPVALVRQDALAELYRYINPLLGGPLGQGWPFDADLNAATVMELLLTVDGVQRVEEVVLFEADLRTRQRHGRGQEVIRLGRDSLFMSFNHRVVVR